MGHVAHVPARQVRVTVSGLPDGAYDAGWLDPMTGAETGTETVTAEDGEMVLEPGTILRDCACRLVRR